MSEPVPSSVDACRDEIASFGYDLIRVDGHAVTFRLLRPVSGDRSGVVIEEFHSDLWSELECAQAALRFVRYFLIAQDR